MVLRSELLPRICEYCLKEYTIREKTEKPYQYLKRKYCSNECKIAVLLPKIIESSRKRIYPKIEIICKQCNKVNLVPPSKTCRPFCNRNCMAKYMSENQKGENHWNWQGGKKERICILCNTVFYVDNCDILRRINAASYCSIRCKAIEHMSKTKKHDTDIEKIMEGWLIENKIGFEKQKIMENRTIVDFFIQPNICIYTDGDYWHSFPRTVKKDIEQTEFLKSKGYKVYRIKGSQIKKGVRPIEILNKL